VTGQEHDTNSIVDRGADWLSRGAWALVGAAVLGWFAAVILILTDILSDPPQSALSAALTLAATASGASAMLGIGAVLRDRLDASRERLGHLIDVIEHQNILLEHQSHPPRSSGRPRRRMPRQPSAVGLDEADIARIHRINQHLRSAGT